MTKDELLEERARLQYIINQAYKDGGGTYGGAMQHIDAGNNPLYAVYSNIFRR